SVQSAHARAEIAFLVQDGDDDLDLRRCPAAELQRVALLEQLTCHADTLGDQPAALLRPASAPPLSRRAGSGPAAAPSGPGAAAVAGRGGAAGGGRRPGRSPPPCPPPRAATLPGCSAGRGLR